jgi:pimeloyl-ACP methyl ester carboxylesterase
MTHVQQIGDGPPLFAVHGWGQSCEFWKPWVYDLAKWYTVYLVDLPGFGRSQSPDTPWRLQNFGEWFRSVVTQLVQQDILLIGHSFGGRVTAWYAARYGCLGLVLYSSSGIPHQSPAKSAFMVFHRLGRRIAPLILYWLHCRIMKPKSYTNPLILDSSRARIMMETYLAVQKHDSDLRSIFQAIRVPTLILSGKRDPIVPVTTTQTIHRLIRESTLHFFAQASHFAHIHNPQEFSDTVLRWLKSLRI